MKDETTSSLQNVKEKDKKLKQLQKEVDRALDVFNNMISHEIHVKILLRIMDLESDDTLNIRASQVQLLLNKCPNFYLEMAEENQIHMSKIFHPFVEKAVSYIEEQCGVKQLQKVKDKRGYLTALVALLTQICSSTISLNADHHSRTLKQCIKVLKKSSQLSSDLPLLSQLLLYATHAFEVFHEGKELLPYLPDFVELLQGMFQIRDDSDEKFFSTSFGMSILKAVQSLFTFNMEFITGEQAENFIGQCLILDEKFNIEIIKILELAVEKGVSTFGQKAYLQILMNCYSVIIHEGVCKNEQHSDSIKVAICIRFFGILVKNTVKKFNKDFLA